MMFETQNAGEVFLLCRHIHNISSLAAPEIQVKIRFQSDSYVEVELENMGNLTIMR